MRRPLTKVPAIGDVLYRKSGFTYFTEGKAYLVQGVDHDGDPYVHDDDGDRAFVTEGHLEYYEVEAPPLGLIVIDSLSVNCSGISEMTLTVDAEGRASIMELVNKSKAVRELEEVERRITELQKQRDELLKEARQ